MAKILFFYTNVQFRFYIAGGIEEFKVCCPTLILFFVKKPIGDSRRFHCVDRVVRAGYRSLFA